jgi:hypothetical protein
VLEYVHLEDGFRKELVDTYWRAGASKLSRLKPKTDINWAGNAHGTLQSLIAFPVNEDISGFVASMVTEHEYNVRWGMLSELMARVGVRKLSDRLGRVAGLKAVLGSPGRADFTRTLEVRMNEFYAIRNGIVHAIAQNSGIGTTVFHLWANFFRELATAIAIVLEVCFAEFSAEIERRKAPAVPRTP